MTRKIIVCALALVSTAAGAEWKTLAESAIGRMSYDTASVRGQGKHVQMRYRIDYGAAVSPAGSHKPGSAVMEVTLDCPARTLGLASVTAYDQSEGRGNVIEHHDFPDPRMEPVRRQSSGVPLLKAACGENAQPYPPQSAPAVPAPDATPRPPAGRK